MIYSQGIKLNPSDIRLYYGRGWASLQLNNNKNAKEDFLYVIDQLNEQNVKLNGESVWDFESFQRKFPFAMAEVIINLKPLLSSKEEKVLLKKISAIEKNSILMYGWSGDNN